MNVGTRMTAAGAFAHLSTLDDVVDEYVRVFSEQKLKRDGHDDPVVGFVAKAPNLAEAIRRACMGRREDGKMFSKGSCVRTSAREQLAELLTDPGTYTLIERAKNFEDIYDLVRGKLVWGIGDMTVYDVSLRIAAYLGISPERYVYLHAGPMTGFRRLMGGSKGSRAVGYRVEVSSLPQALQRLPPHQVEDALCEFRNLLHPGMIK